MKIQRLLEVVIWSNGGILLLMEVKFLEVAIWE